MNLEKRQLGRINAAARTINISISAIAVLMTALYMMELGSDIQILVVVRLLVSLASLVLNIVFGLKWRYENKYRHLSCISLLVIFELMLITATSDYMYIYVFPIAILVLLFQDLFLVYLGGAVAIVSVIIYVAYHIAFDSSSDVSECIYAVLFTIAVSLLSIVITKAQKINTADAIDLATSQAAAQGETSGNIVRLAENLTNKFNEAHAVSTELNESMENNHLAVSEIAESTRINAEAITKQTEQTSGIQEDIRSVGDEASNMEALSDGTSRSVDQGVELIGRLKDQASEVVAINNETKEITNQLNESIQDVEAITETILGISSQTNLLALNASIEAARAGEAGKGFAVVADEIRKLAEETRVSTERIGEIIARLTADAESASTSMTKSAEYAQKQNELIAETGDKLVEIKENTDKLSYGVKNVNNSVDNIISANQLIMESITDLSATGQQVAASTDTALSLSDNTMEALSNMNGLLEEINAIALEMERVAEAE